MLMHDEIREGSPKLVFTDLGELQAAREIVAALAQMYALEADTMPREEMTDAAVDDVDNTVEAMDYAALQTEEIIALSPNTITLSTFGEPMRSIIRGTVQLYQSAPNRFEPYLDTSSREAATVYFPPAKAV